MSKKRVPCAVGIWFVIMLYASEAYATAIYAGWFSHSFEITGYENEDGLSIPKPDDLIVEGVLFSSGDTWAVGNAFSNCSITTPVNVVCPRLTTTESLESIFTISGSVLGYANDPWGSAASIVYHGFAFEFQNLTNQEITVNFDWDYTYDGEISVDDEENENAFLSINIEFGEVDPISGIQTFSYWHMLDRIDTWFANVPYGGTADGQDFFTIEAGKNGLLAGGGTLEGGAHVPEPATLALLGIGLAGLGFARKKKNSA